MKLNASIGFQAMALVFVCVQHRRLEEGSKKAMPRILVGGASLALELQGAVLHAGKLGTLGTMCPASDWH